ncbi:hypothetical protein Cpa01nite_30210 [Cellulomonas pakistanensis]|uniref:Uncharacterized protein n=1 Tax=Cellulomonas pakistanensis TaxID=992287 RepID=A0A919PDM2_9CELL|nr:hypothetical protein Cpa01nite_30210 [Cellulomonas pakistanensis]
MTELETELDTVGLAGQVLARQATHCRAAAQYLSGRGSISGSTGLILGGLAPVSDVVVRLGVAGLRTAGAMCDGTAYAAQRSVADYRQVDEDAGARFARLATDLAVGWSSGAPDAAPGAAQLGPAEAVAPNGWGDTDSWFWQKAASAGSSVGDAVTEALGLADRAAGWSSPGGSVAEAVDAASFLVEPTASENWAQDMRWSAGLVLGSVDWVFEQLCGYSVLEEVIFKPFAGDSREVTKAAGTWTNTGACLSAIGVNHARLVSGTVDGWRGEAGDAFRAAMAVISEGFHQLTFVCDAVASALDAVSVGMKGICAAIGMGLKKLAQLLIEIAAEAAVPGVGWGVLLATAYWKVERIVSVVRLIYTLVETALSLVAAFAEAKAASISGIARFEDLAEGVVRRASQAVTA